jgi:hypothetical protein
MCGVCFLASSIRGSAAVSPLTQINFATVIERHTIHKSEDTELRQKKYSKLTQIKFFGDKHDHVTLLNSIKDFNQSQNWQYESACKIPQSIFNKSQNGQDKTA